MASKTPSVDAIREQASAAIASEATTVTEFQSFNPKSRASRGGMRATARCEGISFTFLIVALCLCVAEISVLVALYLLYLPAFLASIVFFRILGAVTAFVTASKKSDTDARLAWVVFLLIFPPVSLLLYLFGGEPTRRMRLERGIKRIESDTSYQPTKQPKNLTDRQKADCAYIERTAKTALCLGNPTYIPEADDFFEELIERLQKADRYVFIEAYLFNKGFFADKLLGILSSKAAEGVDVRIICDKNTLDSAVVLNMKNLGIRLAARSSAISSVFAPRGIHSKLIIVDGDTAYITATNISDEYLGALQNTGKLKNSALKLDGDAVHTFTLVFLRMWENITGDKPFYAAFLPSGSSKAAANAGLVYPFSEYPSSNLIRGTYNNLIARTYKYAYIMSPYLYGNDIEKRLIESAKGGADIRIVIAGKHGDKLLGALSIYNARRLLGDGVRVFVYNEGYMSARLAISDDECAIVGSSYLGYDSLNSHYGSAAYLSNCACLPAIREDFDAMFACCTELTADTLPKQNLFKRMGLALLRLFAPLI